MTSGPGPAGPEPWAVAIAYSCLGGDKAWMPSPLFLWEISGVGPQMAGGCLQAPSAGVGVRTTRDAGWHLPDTGAGCVLRGGSQAGLTRVALLSSAHLPDPAEGARLQASLICLHVLGGKLSLCFSTCEALAACLSLKRGGSNRSGGGCGSIY